MVTRVHGWIDDKTAQKRFKVINQFEKLLEEHNNTKVLKFYLHISPEEQQERLKERMEIPSKQWKYKAKDFAEASLWERYRQMYEEVFENCDAFPWAIVPADQNWYKEYVIAKTLAEALERLNMKYPQLNEEEQ